MTKYTTYTPYSTLILDVFDVNCKITECLSPCLHLPMGKGGKQIRALASKDALGIDSSVIMALSLCVVAVTLFI